MTLVRRALAELCTVPMLLFLLKIWIFERPFVKGFALIIIVIIQHLYSALKSCKGYGGAGGFRLRLSEQVCFEVFFKGV